MVFISVIIPNFNHASFLQQRIESVLRQTYQNIEVIILDDASSDNSKEVIGLYRFHPKITHIVYNKHNSGSPFKQWKKGIELAKGDWIWIAESDDVANKYFLEEIEKTINSNPTANLFYSDSYLIDEKGIPYNKASLIKNNFFEVNKWNNNYCKPGVVELNENLKYLCTINNASSMVFQKTLSLNFINEISEFSYYGDWFFYIKASLESSIYYLNKPLCSYRSHPFNHVNNHTPVSKTKKEYLSILKFLLQHPLVNEKDELINFFVLHYLGFGLVHDGLIEGTKVFVHYFSVDKKLAFSILKKFLFNKIINRKNRKEYL